MAQSNKRANHGGDHNDQINNLPTDVISNILMRLPVRDIVRTSILSKGWRHFWASVPRLEFGVEFFNYTSKYDPPRLITELLLLHDGPVHEFSLAFPRASIMELNKWILFLARNGVKDLRLRCIIFDYHPQPISSYLFSCQELAYLELMGFKLSLPPNLCGFGSLIELHLSFIIFDSTNALESLISSCPLLDTISIKCCFGYEYINISAPTMRKLYIREYKQVMKSIRLHSANNLIHLSIMGDKIGGNFEKDDIQNAIKSFLNLKSLSLGATYFKIFSTTIPKVISSAIDSLTYLELDGVNFNESEEFLSAICLLKSSTNLEKLVINISCTAATPLPVYLEELERSSCSFSQLRIVNITVTIYHELVLKFIRYLLAHCKSLETLTFNVCAIQNLQGTTKFSIAQDMLQMERASPKAQVKLICDCTWRIKKL